jgi:hypothetical protein
MLRETSGARVTYTLGGLVPNIAQMAKRPAPKPKANHSWDIFRLRGTPSEFIGIAYAPDEQTAIKKAIEEYGITDPQKQDAA